jgi:DNA adenine methylase
MMLPQPIPYQGSKRALAATILRYFPSHAPRLVEPFAGSAAMSLAALHAGKVEQVLINDINAPLIALWETIVERPQWLAARYRQLWQEQLGQERVFYDVVRARFNQTHAPDDFLYLLARCVKASVRYNAQGEFNQSPDNRRKGRQPSAMQRDIELASGLLRGRTQLCAVDYRAVLAEATPEDIVYLDPPYQGVISKRDPRYVQAVTFEQLSEVLHHLNARGIAYILSYDGRTGARNYGQALPSTLELLHSQVVVGVSSQATLLGKREVTIESLYVSPALQQRLEGEHQPLQLKLFEPHHER